MVTLLGEWVDAEWLLWGGGEWKGVQPSRWGGGLCFVVCCLIFVSVLFLFSLFDYWSVCLVLFLFVFL